MADVYAGVYLPAMSRLLLPPKEKSKPKSDVTPTSIRLPPALRERLDAAAKETNRTRAEVIVTFLEFAMEEHLKQTGRGGKK